MQMQSMGVAVAPRKIKKKFEKISRKKERILKKFFLIFRYGECPSGEFSYSIIWARSRQSAWGVALTRYGNYAPLEVITEESFKRSEVKALGAKLYQEIEEEI